MDLIPGTDYVPFPIHGTGESFDNVGIDTDFGQNSIPQFSQSFEDVAPCPREDPFRRRHATTNDETSPNVARAESANVSVNGGDTTNSAKSARGRKRNRDSTQVADNTHVLFVMRSAWYVD